MNDAARAFVPGHATAFFTVDEGADPVETGSRGCGIALTDGVTVTVEPGEGGVLLNGDPVEVEAVDRVLDALAATATVRIETDLPVGAGFGVSGAASLGAAFATNAALDRGLSENELVTLAHGAEVQAGTGLGDVVAQARGGLPLRLEPGGPEHNYVDAVPAPAPDDDRARVEYLTLGELSTAEVIGGDTAAVTAAGERALSTVVGDPTPATVFEAARRFAREADLLTPDVREIVEDVAAAGGTAAMAMLGETVVALGTGLTDAGYDPRVCAVDRCGARLAAGD